MLSFNFCGQVESLQKLEAENQQAAEKLKKAVEEGGMRMTLSPVSQVPSLPPTLHSIIICYSCCRGVTGEDQRGAEDDIRVAVWNIRH